MGLDHEMILTVLRYLTVFVNDSLFSNLKHRMITSIPVPYLIFLSFLSSGFFSAGLYLPTSFEGKDYFSSICELFHFLLFLVQLFAHIEYSVTCLNIPVIIFLCF